MKKSLLALGVVALLAGCCSSGGGMGGGGMAQEYEYHNKTDEYNHWNSSDQFHSNASYGTGSSTAMNSGFVQGD